MQSHSCSSNFRCLSTRQLSAPDMSPLPNVHISNRSCAPSDDVTKIKYLECLRARLGFARFKMRNGWEKSTLKDVEYLWRQKQQQLMKDIPKPRFTQQDVIEKRHVMSLSAKCARVRKPKLRRSLSTPSHWFDDPMIPSPGDAFQKTNTSQRTPSTAPFHPDRSLPKQPSSLDSSNPEIHPNRNDIIARNSLDYLSYAIAMTEGNAGNREERPTSLSQPLPEIEHDKDEKDEGVRKATDNVHRVKGIQSLLSDDTESDLASSSPQSPVTAAAHAIMMFVNSHSA